MKWQNVNYNIATTCVRVGVYVCDGGGRSTCVCPYFYLFSVVITTPLRLDGD